MITDREKQQLCPATGLAIYQKPEWCRVEFCENYQASFKIIGKRILHVSVAGTITENSIREFNEYKFQLLREYFGENGHYIEVKDYGNIDTACAINARIRKLQVQFIQNAAPNCLAFIAYNMIRSIKLIWRVGLAIHTPSFIMENYPNYTQAMQRAKKISLHDQLATTLNREHMLTQPEWSHTSNEFTAKSFIIPELLMYDVRTGYGDVDDVEPTLQTFEKALRTITKNNTPYYRIVDWRSMYGGTIRARIRYIEGVEKLYRKYYAPKITYVIAEHFIYLHYLLSKTRFSTKHVFVKDFEEAADQIRQDLLAPDSPQTPSKWQSFRDQLIHILPRRTSVRIRQKDIDALLNEIGRVNWGLDELDTTATSPNHPFKPVYDALQLISFDIKLLISKTEESNKKLEDAVVQANNLKHKAEKANQAKSDFLAHMSHEVRTPLNPVLGFTRLLLEGNPTPAQKEKLEIIQQRGEDLLSVINDLLDLSKIEAGRIVLHHEISNLHNLADNALKTIAVKAQAKGISTQLIIAPEVPEMCSMDTLRLRQVLLNLLNNAQKFTDEGSITLNITATKTTETPIVKHRIRFCITDTGIGVVPENTEHIFSPFVQGDPSSTRKYGGTGLGLTICRNIIEMMDGKIWYEPHPPHGSNFIFEIVLSSVNNHVTQQNTIQKQQTTNAYSLNILVAEDDLTNQLVAQTILNRDGHHVVLANNGKQAVQLWQENDFDMILMDIQMPVMDGLSAAHTIRELEHPHQRIPIAAMTAHAMEDDREKCIAAGMDHFLTKPIQIDELRLLLQSVNANA